MLTIEKLRELPEEAQKAFLESLTEEEALNLKYNWKFNARSSQLQPTHGWITTLIMCGRGWGKTRCGAEWVRQKIEQGCTRVGIIAPTTADIIKVIVHGESGILNICPSWNKPKFNQTKLTLTWPNGAVAECFSAEKTERLRGPQFQKIWMDEPFAYVDPDEAYNQAIMTLRLETPDGSPPQMLLTSTPKYGVSLNEDLEDIAISEEVDKNGNILVRLVSGHSNENSDNLSDTYISNMNKRLAGTRMGEQEMAGKLIRKVEGAMFSAEDLENCIYRGEKTLEEILETMTRIVVGVDPSGTSGKSGDYQGIVVCGLDHNENFWVLEDGSVSETPAGWGRKAINLYHKYNADRIIAEKNYGGEMVEANIKAIDRNVPVKSVHASKSKKARAEPISNFYQQGRIKHIKYFEELDQELSKMTYDGYKGRGSPDRADAMIWAISELMKKGRGFSNFPKIIGRI